MDSMSVPNLLALSDISPMAMSATVAALAVSPLKLPIREAEKLVTCSMYSLADRPAVLKAEAAFALTTLELSLKSVSTPPRLCSSLAPWLTAPMVMVAAARVTGITTFLPTAARPDFILESPAVTPSFSFTVAWATSLPTDFTLLATPFIREVAPSLSFTKGRATSLPTPLTLLLTLRILSLAASLRAAAMTIFFLRGWAFCFRLSIALWAAVASSRAVRFLSQVACSSCLVLATSCRKALCSWRMLRRVADILSLMEIAPLITPNQPPPFVSIWNMAALSSRAFSMDAA